VDFETLTCADEEMQGDTTRLGFTFNNGCFILCFVALLMPSDAHAHIRYGELRESNKDGQLKPQWLSTKVEFVQSRIVPSSRSGWYHLWGIAILSLFFVWSAHAHKVNAKVIIGCWMMASMAMNIVNKEVALRFSATTLPVIMQMLFAVALFTIAEWRNLKCGKLVDLVKWSVVPFFFTGMLYTSIQSLHEMSLSGVLILRNVLPLFTLFAEKTLFGKPSEVTASMLVSMLVALLGTVVYSCWNVTVTRSGIHFVLANCVLTVVDRILQRNFLHDPDFSVSLPLCMVWNNFLGTLLICGLAFANRELFLWQKMAGEASVATWYLILFSCICGCSVGYLGLKCQKMVSATTFLMLQNFTKVFLILIGMECFGDRLWGISALGCLLSMCGMMWYSYERLPVETAESSKSESTDTEKLRHLPKGDPARLQKAGLP